MTRNILGFIVLAISLLAAFSPRIFMTDEKRNEFYARYNKFYWGTEDAPKDILAAYSRAGGNREIASFKGL